MTLFRRWLATVVAVLALVALAGVPAVAHDNVAGAPMPLSAFRGANPTGTEVTPAPVPDRATTVAATTGDADLDEHQVDDARTALERMSRINGTGIQPAPGAAPVVADDSVSASDDGSSFPFLGAGGGLVVAAGGFLLFIVVELVRGILWHPVSRPS